jgi:hypothetical protein
MSESVGHIILDLTDGRPFVFMVMAYHALWDFYKGVQASVEAETGLKCIRADEVRSSGHDLLQKIHLLIDRAELVIAEISTTSANVFYEVGYALGRNKPVLLLAEKDCEIPTDLKGRELIRHGQSRAEAEQFQREFREHLRARLGSRFALLRDMLLADNPTPAYIVAHPRHPHDQSHIIGERFATRTFGDYAGIRGLLQAFGSVIGEGAGVELVSAQYCHPKLISSQYHPATLLKQPFGEFMGGPVNLYLIGSKKVNPPAGFMLDLIQSKYPGKGIQWYLGRIPQVPQTEEYLPGTRGEAEETGDYDCGLYEIAALGCKRWQGEIIVDSKDHAVVRRTDYGIVVRSAHPDLPADSGRLVVILAGGHSLGTGAACLAATRSSTIRAIREKLPKTHDFEDKTRAFWALIKGTAASDHMLDEAGVEVVKADWYDNPSGTCPGLPAGGERVPSCR